MATKMKLKLKTVFVLYFMVSLLGLVYALMQLGKLALHRSETGKHTSEKRVTFHVSFLQDNAVTVPSMTCPKIGPYLGCGGNWTVSRSRWRSLRSPDSPRNKQPSPPYPPSLSSHRHMQGSCYSLLTTGACSSFSLHLVTKHYILDCSGWCRRPNWLDCPRRSSTFPSYTGSWWRILHTRRHWWLTSLWRVAWLTPTCTCPPPRTANCRRCGQWMQTPQLF